MHFGSNVFGPETARTSAAATLGLILLLFGFVLLRRVIRSRWFRLRDRRVQFVRCHWEEIVSGKIPAVAWCVHRVDRQLVEEIALDRMEVAGEEEARRLARLFVESGLLDRHKRDARNRRGWRRRHAVLTMGRMRVPEALPVLVDALENGPEEEALAAFRALGRLGGVEAGAAIIRRLARPLRVLREALEPALIACYLRDPGALVSKCLSADDGLRPCLARVLAEVAAAGMPEGWTALSVDALPEVRAAAARIFAVVRPAGAAVQLSMLAEDTEWFVRLRATVALGELADPSTIPVLLNRLRDANRLVRLRAASALSHMDGQEALILALASEAKDNYALQALISEFQRMGTMRRLVDALGEPGSARIETALARAARAGGVRMLADLALRHPIAEVRRRLVAILETVPDSAGQAYLKTIHACWSEAEAGSGDTRDERLSFTEGQKRAAQLPARVA